MRKARRDSALSEERRCRFNSATSEEGAAAAPAAKTDRSGLRHLRAREAEAFYDAAEHDDTTSVADNVLTAAAVKPLGAAGQRAHHRPPPRLHKATKHSVVASYALRLRAVSQRAKF